MNNEKIYSKTCEKLYNFSSERGGKRGIFGKLRRMVGFFVLYDKNIKKTIICVDINVFL